LWGEFYRLSLNYFETFNLPVQFDIDLNLIHDRYREIQKSIHPDRFASATKVEQQQSLLKSTQVNEAYQALKNPLLRAKHLIGLHYDKEPAALPADFLGQQMEWEEELTEITGLKELASFQENIEMNLQNEINSLAQLLDQDKNWQAAQTSLNKLTFLSNLAAKTEALRFSKSEN